MELKLVTAEEAIRAQVKIYRDEGTAWKSTEDFRAGVKWRDGNPPWQPRVPDEIGSYFVTLNAKG